MRARSCSISGGKQLGILSIWGPREVCVGRARESEPEPDARTAARPARDELPEVNMDLGAVSLTTDRATFESLTSQKNTNCGLRILNDLNSGRFCQNALATRGVFPKNAPRRESLATCSTVRARLRQMTGIYNCSGWRIPTHNRILVLPD